MLGEYKHKRRQRQCAICLCISGLLFKAMISQCADHVECAVNHVVLGAINSWKFNFSATSSHYALCHDHF